MDERKLLIADDSELNRAILVSVLEKNFDILEAADGKEAIRTACMLAEKGDVILIAGKGHENYQEIKGVKHHFDDKEVLKEIFN